MIGYSIARIMPMLVIALAIFGCASSPGNSEMEKVKIERESIINHIMECAAGISLTSEFLAGLKVDLNKSALTGAVDLSAKARRQIETGLIEKFQSDEARLKALAIYDTCMQRR